MEKQLLRADCSTADGSLEAARTFRIVPRNAFYLNIMDVTRVNWQLRVEMTKSVL